MMQEIIEAKSNPNPVISIYNNDQTPKLSPYEQSRNDRIKSNLERMQNLGLVNLSRQLNSLTSPKRTPRNNPSSEKYSSPSPPSGPTRRSSRLHNATPVSYSEAALTKRDGLWEDKGVTVRLEEGSKPEVYTEEHEKLLGNTERTWTLFVDGCGSDGKRIYDQVKGKTCHQCRQKTLGHRTHCCKCQLVQGQFCGDCLYMRYGEHVLEAVEDPNWICPACRGICNCSLCRQAKGWAPTGALYRKISSLGYKSVAHYLIQTRRSQTTIEVNLPTVNQVSAKRSLPFSDMETPSNRSPHINNEQSKQLMAQSEDAKHDDELKSVKEEQFPNNRNLGTAGQNEKEKPPPNSGNLESYGQAKIPISGNDAQSEILEPLGSELKNEKGGKVLNNGNLDTAGQNEKEKSPPNGNGGNLESNGQAKIHILGNDTESEILESLGSELKNEKDGKLLKNGNLDTSSQTKMPILGSETQSETLEGKGSELKNGKDGQLLNTENLDTSSQAKMSSVPISESEQLEIVISAEVDHDNISDAEQSSKGSLSDHEQEKEVHVEGGDIHADCVGALERTAILKKKSARTAELSPDSIGGRLWQRRRMCRG